MGIVNKMVSIAREFAGKMTNNKKIEAKSKAERDLAEFRARARNAVEGINQEF